jgi:regulator of RNase E activity RraA
MAESPLEGRGTGSIVFCLERALGFNGCSMSGVRPLTRANRFVGRARTLRCLPTRPDVVEARRSGGERDPHRVAIDEVSPGEVLVIDARREMGAAVLGDLLAARIQAAGGRAVVTDGCVRDLPGLAALDFPVFAAAPNAALFGTRHLGIDVGLPIACGGVLVRPGDVLVGDEEGVCVVPAEFEGRVAELVAEQDELDAFSLEQIRAGRPVAEAFPLNAELRAELDRRRRGQAGA